VGWWSADFIILVSDALYEKIKLFHMVSPLGFSYMVESVELEWLPRESEDHIPERREPGKSCIPFMTQPQKLSATT
jgi:hypothetical protein